jgi:hypothetical protein
MIFRGFLFLRNFASVPWVRRKMVSCMKIEFCYGVSNQYESFICLDLMVKNREVPIESYFKW